jgi:hypothetical protein
MILIQTEKESAFNPNKGIPDAQKKKRHKIKIANSLIAKDSG